MALSEEDHFIERCLKSKTELEVVVTAFKLVM
jgi:hypothetical protein